MIVRIVCVWVASKNWHRSQVAQIQWLRARPQTCLKFCLDIRVTQRRSERSEVKEGCRKVLRGHSLFCACLLRQQNFRPDYSAHALLRSRETVPWITRWTRASQRGCDTDWNGNLLEDWCWFIGNIQPFDDSSYFPIVCFTLCKLMMVVLFHVGPYQVIDLGRILPWMRTDACSLFTIQEWD